MLPEPDDAYDLVFATHVLEHVPDPAPLTREMLRVGRAVVIEVPLEANLSARRPAARAASEGRRPSAPLRPARDPLAGGGRAAGAWRPSCWTRCRGRCTRSARRAGAARLKGDVKWALRAGAAAVPPVGERLITMHFAVLALPAAA